MLAVYFYAYGSFTSKAAAFSGIGKAVEYYRILLCPLTCKGGQSATLLLVLERV